MYENTSIVFFSGLSEEPEVYPADKFKTLLKNSGDTAQVILPPTTPNVSTPPAAEDGVAGEVRFDAVQRRLYVHTGVDWAYAAFS